MSKPSLRIVGGESGDRVVPLADETLIGRSPECAVSLEGQNAVSRRHARILRDGDGYVVEDLGSRNGTLVNGKPVAGLVRLKDKDRLKICDNLMIYQAATNGHGPTDDDPLGIGVRESDGAGSTVLTTIDAKSSVDNLAKVRPEAKLKAILEISRELGRTLELEALLPKILDSLFTIFPQADRGLVIRLTPEGKLIPRAVKHRRKGQDTVRFSRTIVRAVIDDKRAILSADASQEGRFALAQSIADFSIRSIMCVPLLAQDQRVLGVIQLDTQSQQEKFQEDDLEILAAVATQITTAIANAEMHESLLTQERIQRELGLARDIQQCFLPQSLPKLPGYAFFAQYEPAGQVGGDYYDFVQLNDGRLAVIVGDVSGKGVPAALVMSKAASDTKVALISAADDLGAVMSRINDAIEAATPDDRFITMVICVIDPKTHEVRIVNAGHMSPIVRRTDGSWYEPAGETVSGLPAGVMPDFPYEAVCITLGPGEQVVLFSDGISEAMNPAQREYGLARLREQVAQHDLSVPALAEALFADVKTHVKDAKQNDDITLVLFGREAEAETDAAEADPAQTSSDPIVLPKEVGESDTSDDFDGL